MGACFTKPLVDDRNVQGHNDSFIKEHQARTNDRHSKAFYVLRKTEDVHGVYDVCEKLGSGQVGLCISIVPPTHVTAR